MSEKKHYIVMNGSIGCLPDNTEVHDTKESAIESILSLFNDYPNDEGYYTVNECKAIRRVFAESLQDDGIFYFPNSGYGAEYVEIIEEECTGAGCEYCEDQYNAMMAD